MATGGLYMSFTLGGSHDAIVTQRWLFGLTPAVMSSRFHSVQGNPGVLGIYVPKNQPSSSRTNDINCLSCLVSKLSQLQSMFYTGSPIPKRSSSGYAEVNFMITWSSLLSLPHSLYVWLEFPVNVQGNDTLKYLPEGSPSKGILEDKSKLLFCWITTLTQEFKSKTLWHSGFKGRII